MIKQKLPYVYFAIPFLIVIMLTGLNFPKVKDEPFIHGTIKRFPKIYSSPARTEKYVDFSNRGRSYRTMPLPGYFAIQFLWGKLVGFKTRKLRLLNVFLGWLAVVVFFEIMTQFERLKINREVALFASFTLLLNPYFFLTSFLIYNDVPALCFALLAIYFYLKKNNTACVMFLTLTILTRQIYIFLPAAIILNDFMQKKGEFFKIQTVAYAIPFLVVAAAVLAWSGHKHLVYAHFPHRPFSFYHLNKQIIAIGIYTAPFLLLAPKRFFKKSNVVITLLFLPLFFIGPLSKYAFRIKGGIFITAVINFSERLNLYGLRYVLLLFWLLGILMLVEAFRNSLKEEPTRVFRFQIIACLAVIFFAGCFWEKYIIMILPPIFILLAQRMGPPKKALAYSLVCFLFILNIAGVYIAFVR